jgi:hypothetical protein
MSKLLVQSNLLMVMCLILSPIRCRDENGNRLKLMPDGKLTHPFTPNYAEWLERIGSVEIIDDDYLAQRNQPESTPDDDDESDDLTAHLLRAVSELDPNNADHFTKDGKPEINALKKIAGVKKLSAPERDALWDEFQRRDAEKSNPPAGAGAATEITGNADGNVGDNDAGTGA